MAQDNPQPEPIKTKPKKSRIGLMFGFFNLIVAVGLAAAGFYFYQQSQANQKEKFEALGKQLQNKDSEISSLRNRFDTQNKTLESVNTKLATQDSEFERGISNQKGHTQTKLEQLTTKLDQTSAELKNSIRMVKRQLSQTRGDFLIADAEYLLSIASQRLQLTGDVKTSIEALEAADQRLRESGDSGVFKVREAIAKELSQLKGVPARNTTDLFLRLNPLMDKIPDLPLLFPSQNRISIAAKAAQAKHEHQAQESSEERFSFDAILKEIKSWVSVRHSDMPLDIVLTPGEVSLIHHTLRLNLETAKLALVNGNETIYTSTLKASSAYLTKHFDPKANETKQFQKELESLVNTPFNVEVPDISQSLKLLRDITKLRIESDKAGYQQIISPETTSLENQSNTNNKELQP